MSVLYVRALCWNIIFVNNRVFGTYCNTLLKLTTGIVDHINWIADADCTDGTFVHTQSAVVTGVNNYKSHLSRRQYRGGYLPL